MKLKELAARSEFLNLVDELETIERRRLRGEVSAAPGSEGRIVEVERRLMEMVSTLPTGDDRRRGLRLVCELSVTLIAGGTTGEGTIRDVGEGGAFVETPIGVAQGDALELEVDVDLLDRKLRVAGRVAWVKPGRGFGVVFVLGSAEAEIAVRRLVVTLLRRQIKAF